jgi:2-aminoadipate transaminase
MTTSSLDYTSLLAKDAPGPSGRPGEDPPYNFTYGHGSPDLLPIEGFVESAARALRSDGRSLAVYNANGGSLGYLPLRQFLVDKLARHRGINVSPDEVLITSGSQQGIIAIMDAFLDPGDTVVTEIFSYAGTIGNLRRHGVNIVGVPLDEKGMRMDLLESTLADLQEKGVKPKFIYTIPTLHNPTGTVMSMDRRREMLRLSRQYQVPIFEDECYADLVFEKEYEHAIRSLDDSNFVLHVGSFSKSLAPGVRLGYVVAPWEVMSHVLPFKMDIGTSTMGQMIVADFFQNNFDAHMEHLRTGLQRKRDTLIAALKEHFGPSVQPNEPRGGMFLWVRFPDGVDTRKALEAAREEGVAYNPGPDWAVYDSDDDLNGHNYVRLCYALPTEEETWQGIERMAKAFQRAVGFP